MLHVVRCVMCAVTLCYVLYVVHGARVCYSYVVCNVVSRMLCMSRVLRHVTRCTLCHVCCDIMLRVVVHGARVCYAYVVCNVVSRMLCMSRVLRHVTRCMLCHVCRDIVLRVVCGTWCVLCICRV
jgi:hypothetical protein